MCQQIVKDSWVDGEELDIGQKIRKCSEHLEKWDKDLTGSFGSMINECKTRLKYLQLYLCWRISSMSKTTL